MTVNIRSGNRDQLFLLPPSIEEWVEEGHLSRILLKIVDQFDLSLFRASMRKDGKGGANYSPEIMVALVFYAFCNQVNSSRKIERLCIEGIAYRMITAGARPDHTTIARFIKNHEAALSELFNQVLALCVKAGMVDLSLLAVDGTKIKANASKARFYDTEAIARQIILQTIDNDDNDVCEGASINEAVPETLRDPEWIKAALKEIQAEQEAQHKVRPDRKTKSQRLNTTDPECRMMKFGNGSGFQPAYNGQAVASADQIIVASDITQDGADNNQLKPMVNQAATNLERVDKQAHHVVVDGGYMSREQLGELSDLNIIMPIRDNAKASVSRCPMEEIEQVFTDADNRAITQTKAAEVLGIDRKVFHGQLKAYRKNKEAGLAIHCLAKRLELEENRQRLAKRKTVIEPIFGNIKFNLGFNHFRRRGKKAVRAEWTMWCTVHNLLKLAKTYS